MSAANANAVQTPPKKDSLPLPTQNSTSVYKDEARGSKAQNRFNSNTLPEPR